MAKDGSPEMPINVTELIKQADNLTMVAEEGFEILEKMAKKGPGKTMTNGVNLYLRALYLQNAAIINQNREIMRKLEEI
jgi:hypothetical protein